MMTSKADVYIKLQILDHEEEIISAVGKGHVVLLAFVFQKDNAVPSEEENKRSSSRQCKSFNKMYRCVFPEVFLSVKSQIHSYSSFQQGEGEAITHIKV